MTSSTKKIWKSTINPWSIPGPKIAVSSLADTLKRTLDLHFQYPQMCPLFSSSPVTDLFCCSFIKTLVLWSIIGELLVNQREDNVHSRNACMITHTSSNPVAKSPALTPKATPTWLWCYWFAISGSISSPYAHTYLSVGTCDWRFGSLPSP